MEDTKPTAFPGKPELGKPCPLGLLLPGEKFIVVEGGITYKVLEMVTSQVIHGRVLRGYEFPDGFVWYDEFSHIVYPTHLIDTSTLTY